MKKFLFLGLLVLTSCDWKQQSSHDSLSADTCVESVEPVVEVDTVALREKAVSQLMSYGARSASIDKDGYLVYEVYSADLSAPADEVARSVYKLFLDVPLSGVRVVNHATNEELGRYKSFDL